MKKENEPTDMERTETLYALLQGKTPEGCKIPKKEMPKLTPAQAWTVIWWLGNQYWKVTDHIEKCEVCGDLYDTHCGGDMLDFGKAPYFFCDSCMESDQYRKKAMSPKNPDKEQRKWLMGVER